MAKYIFVTGGVVSSVGKGITAASIGRILKSRNISVSIQKLDPYLNIDPGTMSPYQHGEVFVTEDGAETDLDLGHYERFIDVNLTSASSITMGQIYQSVIQKERQGSEWLGGTIQIVRHVTNEIKSRINKLAKLMNADVAIVEVGGTVGDIEGLPFLEAIRQLRSEHRNNVFNIHVTLVPHLSWTKELKTKPTQHSVNELRRIGIQPDAIICRSDHPLSHGITEKIAFFCDVKESAVISIPTVPIMYKVPLILEQAGLGELIMDAFNLGGRSQPDLRQWQEMVERMEQTQTQAKQKLRIAIIGKYVELPDTYLSLREALMHAAALHDCGLESLLVDSEELEKEDPDALLSSVNGIVVPGGFGNRGIEGMIRAAQYARTHKLPYLGLCLGMQVMVIEYARHVLNWKEANSTEFAPSTPYPVISLLPEQRRVKKKGGTMRLGRQPCRLVPNTQALYAYDQSLVIERHRHRFEFNNDFREALEKAGLIASGLSPDERLVEIVEVKDHPWMVGTQFHPEFTSRPDRPHPLFSSFIRVAKEAGQHTSRPKLLWDQQPRFTAES